MLKFSSPALSAECANSSYVQSVYSANVSHMTNEEVTYVVILLNQNPNRRSSITMLELPTRRGWDLAYLLAYLLKVVLRGQE